MSELRSKARVFYNALNFDKPLNGLDESIEGLDRTNTSRTCMAIR